MPWRFKVDGALGKAALYTVPTVDSTDDSPLTDPRGNLSRVRFHTDFRYPRIVSENTYTVTLPGRSQNSRGEATYDLGTHGRGGTPLCFGAYFANGSWLPLFISSPLPSVVSPGAWLLGRLLSLGANDTHILLHEYWCAPNFGGGLGSVTFDVRALVTTELL